MNKMIIQDLHNHTIYSDGENTAREIIENAINHNINIVGITDHYYYEGNMDLSLNKYIDELEGLKKEYKAVIEVKSALEICTVPYPEVFKELPYDSINKLDYVLLENLELLPKAVPLEDLEIHLNKIKCTIGLAHTDLYKLTSAHKDRGGLNYLVDFIKRNNIFYEINSNSSRIVFDTIIYEPDNPMVKNLFEVFNENGVKLSVGSDTHGIKYFEYDRLVKANLVIGEKQGVIFF